MQISAVMYSSTVTNTHVVHYIPPLDITFCMQKIWSLKWSILWVLVALNIGKSMDDTIIMCIMCFITADILRAVMMQFCKSASSFYLMTEASLSTATKRIGHCCLLIAQSVLTQALQFHTPPPASVWWTPSTALSLEQCTWRTSCLSCRQTTTSLFICSYGYPNVKIIPFSRLAYLGTEKWTQWKNVIQFRQYDMSAVCSLLNWKGITKAFRDTSNRKMKKKNFQCALKM